MVLKNLWIILFPYKMWWEMIKKKKTVILEVWKRRKPRRAWEMKLSGIEVFWCHRCKNVVKKFFKFLIIQKLFGIVTLEVRGTAPCPGLLGIKKARVPQKFLNPFFHFLETLTDSIVTFLPFAPSNSKRCVARTDFISDFHSSLPSVEIWRRGRSIPWLIWRFW